jgi:hypothetical protein
MPLLPQGRSRCFRAGGKKLTALCPTKFLLRTNLFYSHSRWSSLCRKSKRILEQRKARNGSVDIHLSYAQKDDAAVAVALAAHELSRWPSKREPIVEVIPVAPPYQSSIAIPRQESSFSRSRFLERRWIRIGG